MRARGGWRWVFFINKEEGNFEERKKACGFVKEEIIIIINNNERE